MLGAEEDADFSMCAGEFIEVYKDQLEEWDAIATCFFIGNIITQPIHITDSHSQIYISLYFIM